MQALGVVDRDFLERPPVLCQGICQQDLAGEYGVEGGIPAERKVGGECRYGLGDEDGDEGGEDPDGATFPGRVRIRGFSADERPQTQSENCNVDHPVQIQPARCGEDIPQGNGRGYTTKYADEEAVEEGIFTKAAQREYYPRQDESSRRAYDRQFFRHVHSFSDEWEL